VDFESGSSLKLSWLNFDLKNAVDCGVVEAWPEEKLIFWLPEPEISSLSWKFIMKVV